MSVFGQAVTSSSVPVLPQSNGRAGAFTRPSVADARVLVSLICDFQEFQLIQAAEARETCELMGLACELIFADNNSLKQLQQLFDHIRAPVGQRPNIIVVEGAAPDGWARVAQAAVEQGISWVLLSGRPPYVDEFHQKYPELLVASAIVDDEQIGRIQAQQFRALLPKGGRVLYVEGPSNSVSTILRRKGMEAGIGGAGITVDKPLTGDFTERSGERVMSAWLRLTVATRGRPDLIGVQNDAMAMGVRKALEAQRPDWLDIPITGCDGLPSSGQRMVANRTLAATVIKPSTASLAVELVGNYLRGEAVKNQVIIPAQSFPSIDELSKRGTASRSK